MAFNPLEHKGIPVEDQLRSWRELDVEPIDPHPSFNSATAHTLTGPVVSIFDPARDMFGKAMDK